MRGGVCVTNRLFEHYTAELLPDTPVRQTPILLRPLDQGQGASEDALSETCSYGILGHRLGSGDASFHASDLRLLCSSLCPFRRQEDELQLLAEALHGAQSQVTAPRPPPSAPGRSRAKRLTQLF